MGSLVVRSRRGGLKQTGPVCYFCAGEPQEILELSPEWRRPICRSCMVDMKLISFEEARRRSIEDLVGLQTELA